MMLNGKSRQINPDDNPNNDPGINCSRRQFLKISSTMGAGLLIGFHMPGQNKTAAASDTRDNHSANGILNAWIRISRDDLVTIQVNHSEMGQGIITALPMIVAEELEADWSKVSTQIAPAQKVYKNPKFNTQMTASSTSVSTSWDLLRTAGAAAREVLILSAARIWQVSPAKCHAKNGKVIHESSNRQLSFGELAGKADGIAVPENIRLKQPEEFTIIGKSVPRLDSLTKIDGSAQFGIDFKKPDLLVAIVVHPPVFGTKAMAFEDQKAKALKGVRHILAIDEGIAVVAETFWQARVAVEVLEIEWEKSPHQEISSESLFKRWAQLSKEEGKSQYETGDADGFMEKGSDTIKAAYEVPYQGHATPEPMNCTADVKKDRCDIFVPTQHQDAAKETASRITGLNYESVTIHTTYVGCGLGRRIVVDYVSEAVQISKKIKAPVKVIWTREEDMQHDFLRPATYNVLQAGLDDGGMPVAWKHKIVGADVFSHMLPLLVPSILPNWMPRFLRNAGSFVASGLLPRVIAGKKAIKGAGPLPYGIPNMKVGFINDDPGIPIGFWRSVAASSNAHVVECFMDEIAFKSNIDPYELRYRLLSNDTRMQRVMELAADKAGWKNPLPKGIYRGIAVHDFQETDLTFVAEVSVDDDGRVKVHRVVCAVDCGIVINPKIIKAQMESAIAFGLTATLKSAVTIEKGRIKQSNFDDFPILRMDEMPKVEVYIVKSSRPPTGIGEAGVPLIAPAVANAVFAATGKRIRKLPILPEDLKKEA